MTEIRRLDVFSIAQLVFTSALFLALWLIIFFTHLTAVLNVFVVVLISLVAVALGIVAVFHSWHQFGGRATMLQVNGWIKAREVPPSVPREVWFPLLRKRERNAVGQRSILVLTALWIALAFVYIFWPSAGDASPWSWKTVALCYLGVSAYVIYYNLRWLPVIRRLLYESTSYESTSYDSTSESESTSEPNATP